MALFEDVFKLEGAGSPLAFGIGALFLAPVALPLVGRVLRPAAKELLKIGIYAYDEAQEAVSGAYEATGNLIAEARAEHENESKAKGPSESYGHGAGHRKSGEAHQQHGEFAGQPTH